MSKDLLEELDAYIHDDEDHNITCLLAKAKEKIVHLETELSFKETEINRLKNHFRLAEECSEVIKVASKSARFGDEFINPVTGLCNSKELMQECADVEVAIDDMSFPRKEFLEAKGAKIAKLGNWKQKEV